MILWRPLPVRLGEYMEQLEGRIAHELGAKLNDVVLLSLLDSTRLAVRLGHRHDYQRRFWPRWEIWRFTFRSGMGGA